MSMHNTRTLKLMQLPALFLLRHVKMSSLRKVYLRKAHFLRDLNVRAHMSSK